MLATQRVSQLSQKIDNPNSQVIPEQQVQPVQAAQPIQPAQTVQAVQQVNQSNQIQENPMVVNNFNIVNQSKDTIIVEHNKEKNEFVLKDANKQLIGSFYVLQIFKYINEDVDNYLVNTNIGTAKELIIKYIYSKEKDPEGKYDLISYLDSPFTGNIDLIAQLYSDIIKLEDELNKELLDKKIEIAEQIKIRNNKFIYNLLGRIIKLSNTLVDQINSNPDQHNKTVKDNLIRYSAGSVYKISQMIKDDVTIKSLQLKNVKEDISKLGKIQESMSNKLNSLQETIDNQTTQINTLIQQLERTEQRGGNKSSSSKSSNSSKSTNSSNTSSSESFTTETVTTKNEGKLGSTSQSTQSKSLSKSVSQSVSQPVSKSISQSAGKKSKSKKLKDEQSTISRNLNLSEFNDFSLTSVSQNIKSIDELSIAKTDRSYKTDKTKSLMKSYSINGTLEGKTNESYSITSQDY
jgi:hypothetical protein